MSYCTYIHVHTCTLLDRFCSHAIRKLSFSRFHRRRYLGVPDGSLAIRVFIVPLSPTTPVSSTQWFLRGCFEGRRPSVWRPNDRRHPTQGLFWTTNSARPPPVHWRWPNATVFCRRSPPCSTTPHRTVRRWRRT